MEIRLLNKYRDNGLRGWFCRRRIERLLNERRRQVRYEHALAGYAKSIREALNGCDKQSYQMFARLYEITLRLYYYGR